MSIVVGNERETIGRSCRKRLDRWNKGDWVVCLERGWEKGNPVREMLAKLHVSFFFCLPVAAVMGFVACSLQPAAPSTQHPSTASTWAARGPTDGPLSQLGLH